ncbi:Outer membrane lipoprotein blc precursor [Buttiauxella agrestis]|uniref:Outer membrane lipoprotein Blc n=1 Tax=Buttiauxella agrestis TaxID=82977 RepID=A0A381CCL2_9ENTR|nr:lipocalin family protein [Buttiauxella agrestis]SUW65658.1 Outer membrane lipoprotein blc precursor [Buttiauxella agrestis]
MRIWPIISALAVAFLVVSCSSPTPPPGTTVVNHFEAKRYLGKWYEIARMDHSFERGLEQVTATYSTMDDGGIQVINRGFNPDRQMWQQSIGKAYFTGDPNRAALKVSFFGPFYGGYNVIAIDKDYRHALVCGPDKDYLWILSRTPTISNEVKQQMLNIATQQGFSVDKLMWIKQPAS